MMIRSGLGNLFISYFTAYRADQQGKPAFYKNWDQYINHTYNTTAFHKHSYGTINAKVTSDIHPKIQVNNN